jgi:hypothetical protein
MDRASGPLETVEIENFHFKVPTKTLMMPIVNAHLAARTEAPKARTISAWGNAPGRSPAAKGTRAEGPLYHPICQTQGPA